MANFIMMKRHSFILLISLFFLFQAFPQVVFGVEEKVKEIYLRAFNLYQQASTDKREGNLRLAQEQFQRVQSMLFNLQELDPNWQKNIVDYLREESRLALEEIHSLEAPELTEQTRQIKDYQLAKEQYAPQEEPQPHKEILRQKEQKLERLLSKSQITNQKVQVEIERLQKEKAEFKSQISHWKNKFKTIDANNALLILEMKKLEVKASEVDPLLASREKANQTITQLYKKEKSLLKHQQNLTQLLNEKEKTLHNLDQSHQQLAKFKDKKIKSITDENAVLLERIQQFEDFAKGAREQRDKLQKEKEAIVEKKIAPLVKQRDALKEELVSVSEQLSQSVSQIAALQKKISQDLSRKTVKELEKKIAQFKKEANELLLNKEKTYLEAQNSFKQQLAAKEEENAALANKIIEVKNNYEGIIKDLNLSVDNLKTSVEEKLHQAKKQNEENLLLSTESLNAKVAELNELLVKYKKKYQTSLLRAEKKHMEQVVKFKETISLLQSQMVAKQDPLEKKKDLEKIVQSLDPVAQTDELLSQKSFNQDAVAFYNRGVDFAEKGEIDKAEKEFVQSIGIFPDFFEAHYNLGRTYVMKGNQQKAIQAYLKALSIKEDPDVYYGLGAIYWEMGEWAKVIENWEGVLKLNPEHPLARQWLPKARKQMEQAKNLSTL